MPEFMALGHFSVRRKMPWLIRYGIALVMVAVAFGLTLLVPAIRTGTPFMFFFLAVAFSALLGNFRAGLFAIVLSLITVSLWIMPSQGWLHIRQNEALQLSAFLVVSSIISALVYTIDHTRQVIHEQSESFRTTLASIGDAVMASNTEGNVVWMNAVAAELTGWQVEAAIGAPVRQVFQIVNEETRAPVVSPVERVLAEGRAVGLANHTLLIAKDGKAWPIDDSAAPIRDAQGEIRGVVLIFRDVSERRQREQALQASEERLRMALQAGRMVAWDWDVRADQIWSTGTFVEIYGLEPNQTVGKSIELVHPEDYARHAELVDGVETRGGDYHSEYRIIRPTDGRILWLEEWGSAMLDGAGAVEKIVGLTVDVTERKRAEIALQQLNETLEQRVTERTAELEQINRELVQFTNVVSHDLKAPLRAITTLSNWIGEERAPAISAQAQSYLDKIQQRVARMETMLNDLVAYTRAGRVRYKVEQVNTLLLAREIINLLEIPAGLAVTVVEPMPVLMTERIPLEAVLVNLIGNAVKHHHRPVGGKVEISALDLGERVEFCVEDNGPGIASEQQTRIFGVFQTLRPRDEVEGSGMGLAIAKRLVEGRGGVLEVKSELGVGSTFRFTWPKQSA